MRYVVIVGLVKGLNQEEDQNPLAAAFGNRVILVEADSAQHAAQLVGKPGMGHLHVLPGDFVQSFREIPGFYALENEAQRRE